MMRDYKEFMGSCDGGTLAGVTLKPVDNSIIVNFDLEKKNSLFLLLISN